MGRLKKPFGQRSDQSQSREPARIFVIATEGDKTEPAYFNGLKAYSEELGMKDKVIVEVLEKEDPTDNKSAPQHVKDLLDEYVRDYGIEHEELWMVVDREQQESRKPVLKEIITACKNARYNVALTNPCFEFWLLLHLPDISQYSEEELLNNRKINKTRRFIDKQLSKRLRGYDKSNLKFEKFWPHLETAIKQASLFANNLDDIIDKLGTNVHVLVESILRTESEERKC